MKTYSTREAAKLLGIHLVTLQRYIAAGKVSAPKVQRIGKGRFRAWKKSDVERVRKALLRIADGRTRKFRRVSAGRKGVLAICRVKPIAPVPAPSSDLKG